MAKDFDSTVALVQAAKAGDASAWEALVARFHKEWLEKFHGRLGRVVAKVYDTDDLVRSALASAWADLSSLKTAAVFFSWVTAVIRHKLFNLRRKFKREAVGDPFVDHNLPEPTDRGRSVEDLLEAEETYLKVIEMVLELFPVYPEEMATMYLRHVEGWSPAEIAAQFDTSLRTVYNRVRDGLQLLRERLSA